MPMIHEMVIPTRSNVVIRLGKLPPLTVPADMKPLCQKGSFSPLCSQNQEILNLSTQLDTSDSADAALVPWIAIPSNTGSLRTCFGNVLFAMAHAAAFMGAKWNDLLSGKIITLQERIHRHGHRSPPIRISQEDHIICLSCSQPVLSASAWLWHAVHSWQLP